MKLKSTEKAYLAGLIDGEGCIFVKKRLDTKFLGYQVMLTISQKNLKDLERIKKFIGLKCYFRKYGSRSLNYASNQAYQILKTIGKYLIFKQEEAILAIYFYEKLKSHRWKKSIELDDMRECIFDRIKEIKKEKYTSKN